MCHAEVAGSNPLPVTMASVQADHGPRWLGAGLIYTGLTVALAFPLVRQLGDVVANDLGDPLLNAWILWWNAQHVPLSAAWWNAPSFFPFSDTLALSDLLLGLSLFTTPLIWLGASPILAYNVAFLLTFVLSALGAYALGVTLTKRRDVACVVGLLYAFAPYRMAQFAHVQVLASFWMPVALVGLHKYVDDRRLRWLAAFAGAMVLQGLTSGYYLLFFPVLVGLWVLWFLPRGHRLAALAGIAGACVVSAAVLAPFLVRYQAVHVRFGFRRLLDEILFFSPKVTDLARGSADLWLWGPWLQHPGPEADIFPGLTSILLVAAALIVARRSESTSEPRLSGWLPWPIRLLLVLLATALSLVAVRAFVTGRSRMQLFGFIVSARNLPRSLSLAFYTWVIVGLAGPRFRRLVHAQSPLAFYVFATLIMWLLCFGPAPSIGEVEVLAGAPYGWLMRLPGFDGLRVPARFAMLAVLCLSAAGGLALARVQSRLGRSGQIVLVVLAALGALAEGWRSVPVRPVPEPTIVSPADEAGAVLELPLGDPQQDVLSQYRGVVHGHPVVNGYSGYAPPHYPVLYEALVRPDASVMEALAALGVRHVVVFHERDRQGAWRDLFAGYPGAATVRAAANQTQYRLPAPTRVALSSELTPLEVVRLDASVLPQDARLALDGDLATRWQTGGPQIEGQYLIADLGRARSVRAVELALGEFRMDFPRRLAVDCSLDGIEWITPWQGGTGGLAVAAALADLPRMPVRVTFAATDARFVRLRQIAPESGFYWSVAELRLFGH